MSKRKSEFELSYRELNYLKRGLTEKIFMHEHLKKRILTFGIDANKLNIIEICLRVINL